MNSGLIWILAKQWNLIQTICLYIILQKYFSYYLLRSSKRHFFTFNKKRSKKRSKINSGSGQVLQLVLFPIRFTTFSNLRSDLFFVSNVAKTKDTSFFVETRDTLLWRGKPIQHSFSHQGLYHDSNILTTW